ncbi:MAG: cytochrome c oxidase subunit II [Pseudomonadota bacterium]|jgi:cytochrome c oxidase subunit 2
MLNRKVLSALGVLLGAAPAVAYDSSYNMPVGVTQIAREVHSLHMIVFWICVAIAVAVFGAMIYSIIAFRKSKGAVADTTMLHSTIVEVIWTTIPVLILVGMAVPAAKTLVRMDDTRNAELSIKITGYQWKWQYEYLGKGISFYSSLGAESNYARQLHSGIDPNTVKDYLLEVDHEVVVPVDTKVRLLLTANDVIHSWWVPDFAVKKDAIPGFINEAWFKSEKIGHYTGQCTELCGRDHGFMPIVVNVVSKEDFARWVADQQAAAKAAAEGAAPTATTATTNAPAASAAAAR